MNPLNVTELLSSLQDMDCSDEGSDDEDYYFLSFLLQESRHVQ